jgi:3-hydroxyacyl-CoA dehydrogenase
MIELGKLGRKTSAGWYRYPGGGGKVEDPIVADLAIEEAHFAEYPARITLGRKFARGLFWP